jgi:hypothetical protein
LPSDDRHKAWLEFIRKALAVPADYSIDDMRKFLKVAETDYPSLLPIVYAYLQLAESSQTEVLLPREHIGKRNPRDRLQMHLFDLLRQKAFFPQNLDLAEFASRVLPQLRTHRFDKMSRSDIAARIIEYLESQQNADTRNRLEASMRDALQEMKRRTMKQADRKSFLSKWEKIIKGTEL